MDFFATLTSIVFPTPESEPATAATPIDAVDGNSGNGGRIVA
jgi:hypothetical protein